LGFVSDRGCHWEMAGCGGGGGRGFVEGDAGKSRVVCLPFRGCLREPHKPTPRLQGNGRGTRVSRTGGGAVGFLQAYYRGKNHKVAVGGMAGGGKKVLHAERTAHEDFAGVGVRRGGSLAGNADRDRLGVAHGPERGGGLEVRCYRGVRFRGIDLAYRRRRNRHGGGTHGWEGVFGGGGESGLHPLRHVSTTDRSQRTKRKHIENRENQRGNITPRSRGCTLK